MTRPEERLRERGGAIELLRAPALLFGALARLRGALYDRRLLPSYAVDVPVVSVGNLSAGGTGKTPLTAWLVRAFGERGLRPAIVSRGYGASDGAPNDEARMLHALFPEVPHLQDRDRVDAARRAADLGIDVVIVDDGFQHRRLARDLDVVLVDALRPFGLARPTARPDAEPVRAFLPRGLLREPLSALRRATVCVITRADAVSADELQALRSVLEESAPNVPVATAAHRPARLRARRPVGDNYETLHLEDLAGLEVDLLSGIGNPGAFQRTVEELGATVVDHRAYADHHAFTREELSGLGDARPVVTTAKDAARLAGLEGVAPPRRLLVLDVEFAFLSGEEHMRAALDALPIQDAGHRRAAMHGGLHG